MGNVTKSGIWSPGRLEAMDPEVWSASLTESIEQGLGVRMEKQETKVGLRATAPEVFTVTDDPGMAVPLTVGGFTGSRAPEPDFAPGNHATGIDIEGGRAVILTSGLYTMAGQVSVRAGEGMTPHGWDFYGTVNNSIFGLPAYGATSAISFASGMVSDTRYLIAGDTVGLTIGIGTDHIGSILVQDAMLTLSMAYAT